MSKKFLVPIDLNQLELQNARLQNLATAPSNPVAGQVYYNTTNKKAYVYNGTAWVPWEADTTVSPATANPKMDGTAAVGTATKYAREDHVHPSDTNKVDKVSGKGLSTNDYTSTEKTKLSGIATGAEVNQNAFSYVKVDTVTVSADSKTDTLELIASNNISIVADANGDSIAIAADNTTYDDATTSVHGLMTAADKTKLNGIATGAEVNVQSDWNVTTTTDDAYIKNKPTLGDAAAKGVDTSITSGSTSTNVPTSKAVADLVSSAVGAADAMRFKGTVGTGGTVTTLPTSGVKVGDTYRVITAGTYAGEKCEVGDLIIATATTPTWTVAQTNIDGAITGISGTAPITVSGSGASRTVAINAATTSAAGSMSAADKTKLDGIATGAEKNRTYTAVTGKPTANQTPAFGSTFTVSQISQSTTGQITATDRTVTIPSTEATTTKAGLMSADDKTKLNSVLDSLSMKLELYSVPINAGDLRSTPVPGIVCGYRAYDASTGDEVVVDSGQHPDAPSMTAFSIASAYANDIFVYMAVLPES